MEQIAIQTISLSLAIDRLSYRLQAIPSSSGDRYFIHCHCVQLPHMAKSSESFSFTSLMDDMVWVAGHLDQIIRKEQSNEA